MIWETVIRNLEFLDRAEKAGRTAAFRRWAWNGCGSRSSASAGSRGGRILQRCPASIRVDHIAEPSAIPRSSRRHGCGLRSSQGSDHTPAESPHAGVSGRREARGRSHLGAVALPCAVHGQHRGTGSLLRRLQHATDPALARRTLDLALTEERPFALMVPLVPDVAQGIRTSPGNSARTNAVALLAKVPDGGAFATRNTTLVSWPPLVGRGAGGGIGGPSLPSGSGTPRPRKPPRPRNRSGSTRPSLSRKSQVDAWIARKRSVR